MRSAARTSLFSALVLMGLAACAPAEQGDAPAESMAAAVPESMAAAMPSSSGAMSCFAVPPWKRRPVGPARWGRPPSP
jgi:hypothetical protein